MENLERYVVPINDGQDAPIPETQERDNQFNPEQIIQEDYYYADMPGVLAEMIGNRRETKRVIFSPNNS